MDELVDFWGAGFEDEGPEVGDGGEDLGALCVGGFGEGVLLLDLGIVSCIVLLDGRVVLER